jgi:hypothetical protein
MVKPSDQSGELGMSLGMKKTLLSILMILGIAAGADISSGSAQDKLSVRLDFSHQGVQAAMHLAPGLVGTVLFFAVDYTERLCLPWHVSQRARHARSAERA